MSTAKPATRPRARAAQAGPVEGRQRSTGPAPLPDLEERRRTLVVRLQEREKELQRRSDRATLSVGAEREAARAAAEQRLLDEGKVVARAGKRVGHGLERTGQKELKASKKEAAQSADRQALGVADWERPELAPTTSDAEKVYRDNVHAQLMHDKNLKATRKRAAELLRQTVQQAAVAHVSKEVLRHAPIVAVLQASETDTATTGQEQGLASALADQELTSEKRRVQQRVQDIKIGLSSGLPQTRQDELLAEEAGAEALALAQRFETAAVVRARTAAMRHGRTRSPAVVKAAAAVIELDEGLRTRLKTAAVDRTKAVLESGPRQGTAQGQELEAELGRAKASVSASLEQGAMGGQAGLLAKAIDALVPRVGDEAELDIELRVNGGGWYVGLHVIGSLEKDDDTSFTDETTDSTVLTRGSLVVMVTGGGELPGGAKLGAEAGFFIEAASKRGGAGIAQMVSYGLYRNFKESRVPREFEDALWGQGGVTASDEQHTWQARNFEAEVWSRFVEATMDAGDEFWSGGIAGLALEAGQKGVVDVEAKAHVRMGKSYDKETIAAARQRDGTEKVPTAAPALLKRGPEKSLGVVKTRLETSVSAEAGPFSGELGGQLTFTSTTLTGMGVEGMLSATIPTAVASPADIALKVADAAARLGPQMYKAVARSTEEAKKDKKKYELDIDSRPVELAVFEDGAVDVGRHVLDVLDVPLQAEQTGIIGAMNLTKEGAAEYVEDLEPDASVLSATTTLQLIGRWSRAREATLGPRGVEKLGEWNSEAKLELRHEKGLEIGMPGLASVSFKRSSRLLRIGLWPLPPKVDEKAKGTAKAPVGP